MAERKAPHTSGSPPAEPQPTHGGPAHGGAAQPASLVLGPARYVPLTAEQEQEAIIALARLLALVREQHQQQSS